MYRSSVLRRWLMFSNKHVPLHKHFFHVNWNFVFNIIFIDSLWISHHTPQSRHFPFLPYLLSTLVTSMHKRKLKLKPKLKKEQNILLRKMHVTMYPTVYFSVHTSSLTNVHCNELLAWFKISGFCDFINIGSSPGLLSVILLLTCIMGILKLWIRSTGTFINPNHA